MAGAPYSAKRTQRAVAELVEAVTAPLPQPPVELEASSGTREVQRPNAALLHPYCGFHNRRGLLLTEQCVRFFESGLADTKYTVMILGGSVADNFSRVDRGALDQLVRWLETDARLEGKPVEPFRFAVPGHKPPQQVTLLAYLLSRGCRPDLIINIDGYNEVVFGTKNAAGGAQPTWPSMALWSLVSLGDRLDPEGVDLLVDVRNLERRIQRVAERAGTLGFQHSCLLGKLTLARLARLHQDWMRAHNRYAQHVARSVEDASRRPFPASSDRVTALRAMVRVWYESSLSMHLMCEARGIRYVHILQPSLHDPGSKPLTDEERGKATGRSRRERSVREGYPLLRDGIETLRTHGVRAFDFTGVFAGVEETLYSDSCHFGRRGNEILAHRLTGVLGPILSEEARRSRPDTAPTQGGDGR